MILNQKVELRLGLRCYFMSNSSSPQSTSETQLQGQVAGNGGVTSGSLQIGGSASHAQIDDITTESEGGIAASGGSTVNVTTDDPQVLEAAISSNTQIAGGAETLAMDAATQSNNSLTSLESDFAALQADLTNEAATVNLAQSGAPAAAYDAYEQTNQTPASTTSTDGLSNLVTIVSLVAAGFAIYYYARNS